MNKIFVLTLAMAFAGTAHAQISAHPKSAAGIVNKASVSAQNAQGNGNASTATGAPTRGNAAAPQHGLLRCAPPNAPKNADTASTACRPTKTVQL